MGWKNDGFFRGKAPQISPFLFYFSSFLLVSGVILILWFQLVSGRLRADGWV